jgi:hypothetical protein
MSKKREERKTLQIKPSDKKLSLRESISRLETQLLEEQANGNKRAVDSIRKIIECFKKKEKES